MDKKEGDFFMQKWEYHMLVSEFFYSSQTRAPDITQITEGTKILFKRAKPMWDKVIELGNEGWELVSVVPSDWDGSTNNLVFFFKRPK